MKPLTPTRPPQAAQPGRLLFRSPLGCAGNERCAGYQPAIQQPARLRYVLRDHPPSQPTGP